jgi:DNA-binding transcriptional regulator YdaS (Cro superfamily)
LGVPQSFVSKMASGEKPVPVEHGAAIEAFTDGAFLRSEYWPAKCGRIWPDLAEPQPITPAAQEIQAPAAINSEAQEVVQEVA